MKRVNYIIMTGMLAVMLAACGSNKNTNQGENGTSGNPSTEGEYGDGVTLEDVKQAVVDTLGDNYWPDTSVPEEMLQDVYGLTADMYDDILAETPMISSNVDTLIIVKAKNGQVEAVEAALDQYRERMINDTMQYPMNVGKIQASRIEVYNNYVCFVQLGADPSGDMELNDEEIIQRCQEENERALQAIENALAQ